MFSNSQRKDFAVELLMFGNNDVSDARNFRSTFAEEQWSSSANVFCCSLFCGNL